MVLKILVCKNSTCQLWGFWGGISISNAPVPLHIPFSRVSVFGDRNPFIYNSHSFWVLRGESCVSSSFLEDRLPRLIQLISFAPWPLTFCSEWTPQPWSAAALVTGEPSHTGLCQIHHFLKSSLLLWCLFWTFYKVHPYYFSLLKWHPLYIQFCVF